MAGWYIRGAQIVTMNDSEEVLFGDVRVERDRIVHVGAPIAPQPDDRIIEAAGKVLLPGLIQTHIHLCQTLFRGQADDLELLDWLSQRIWPLEAARADVVLTLDKATVLREANRSIERLLDIR